MEKDIKTGSIEMAAAMLISGTIGWFVLMSGQPVIDVVLWRCLFGALTLLVICGFLGHFRAGTLTWRLFALALLGGVAIVVNWLLLFAAYSHASISIATIVYNTQPFMLLAIGALFFRERITVTKLFWLAIAFAGMIAIVQAKPSGTSTGADYLTGIAMALGAAFFYALAALVAKKLKGTPPHLIALIQVVTGIAMLLPFAGTSGLPAEAYQWALLIAMGAIHTGLMYILLYSATQKLPTHLTGALSFIYPVAALAVDRIAFGHLLQPAQLAGSAAILMAVAGMTFGWTLPRPLRHQAG
ncbi:multidrug DMT transporter permease [Paramesorhizobium deserti]|uniref:Multidrug DMT transporter permease n=1 Tax=Paramesorhizobium deserti TaxID=1494590 RepID=A0A135HRW1_9HYPH|nr:DMT family transporter [Paramesorhizobium deserti]KXF75948.1 multidrug DMT transporter permease [Paramesorhizobium deserti]